ncbi:MAG: Flp family type IVb pilin [Kiloniellaceae bacterium]|nr:Flp family type IVb pilin [Kiloniellaceae bacterium]
MDVLNWIGEDERGTAAIEYGLIAALISVAGIAALTLAGESLEQLLNIVATAVWPPA